MPKVTVLMPVYNGEEYLHEAIDSILDQTFKDFEFLIIDDGSIDKSVDIINSYQDHRLILIKNEYNLGLVKTLNRGLLLAKGEYIARMDSDDISLAERLEQQISFLDAHPEVGLLGTNAQIIDAQRNLKDICNIVSGNQLIKWQMCFRCPLIHPTIVMRKKIADIVNGYSCDAIKDREKYSGEDYDLWRRIGAVSQIDNLPNILLYLRKHDSNITTTYLEEHIKNAAIINNLVIQEYVDVSFEKTFSIFTNKYQNNQEILESILLISRIHQKFLKTSILTSLSKKIIAQDAANQIFSLISNYYKRDLKLLMILLFVIYLNPSLLLKKLIHKGRKLLPQKK